MPYVIVKFRPEDARSYTYESGDETYAIGDEAKAPDNHKSGWKRVTVVGLTDEKPSFACKALLGKAEPKPVEGGE